MIDTDQDAFRFQCRQLMEENRILKNWKAISIYIYVLHYSSRNNYTFTQLFHNNTNKLGDSRNSSKSDPFKVIKVLFHFEISCIKPCYWIPEVSANQILSVHNNLMVGESSQLPNVFVCHL